MRDVSRVEYDAALTRVRAARCEGRVCLQFPSCSCALLTLAALGLDEPPTEGPKPHRHEYTDGRCHLCGEPTDTQRDVDQMIDRAIARAREPEPPKACPTCGGRGELKYPGACRINCDRCKGSGIDGGTPKACPTCGSGWTYHHACPDRGSGIDGGTA